MNQKQIIKITVSAMALLALLGLSDAIYLTIKHYEGSPATCLLAEGCDAVLKSEYAVWNGLPVALGGVLYYGLVFILAMYVLGVESRSGAASLGALTVIGAGVSSWFLYVQAFILGAYCSLCLFSALISGLLFVGGLAIIVQIYGHKKLS